MTNMRISSPYPIPGTCTHRGVLEVRVCPGAQEEGDNGVVAVCSGKHESGALGLQLWVWDDERSIAQLSVWVWGEFRGW